MSQTDDDLSYLYAAFLGSRQEIVSEAFGTRGESGWGHLGCKIWCYAIAAHQSLISIGDSELINMSARAMRHPNLAPSIILDKKFAIFVSHLSVRLLMQPSRGYAMLSSVYRDHSITRVAAGADS
jgi:hypothetical protein